MTKESFMPIRLYVLALNVGDRILGRFVAAMRIAFAWLMADDTRGES